MKIVLSLIICSISLIFCSLKAGTEQKEIIKTSFDIDTMDYKTQVLPVLQKNCSPCHFSGGKMYERMPFDNSQTIISHGAGVLKQIKDKQENALIKQFIQEIKPR